jgi:ABC-type uncharacterized transport system substrate-binding protein
MASRVPFRAPTPQPRALPWSPAGGASENVKWDATDRHLILVSGPPRVYRKRVRWLLLAAVMVIGGGVDPPAARAHPHAFLESTVTVVFGVEGPVALEIGWEFDEMFSALLLTSFDSDRNGTFSLEESRQIEQKDFAGLRYFQYFVDLTIDGRSVPEVTPRDFQATVNRGIVRYRFTVPVAGAAVTHGVIRINVVDPTIFYAVSHARIPVLVQAPSAYRVQCGVRRDPQTNRPEGIQCDYQRHR